MPAAATAPKGLEGIVATTSSICWIDGDAGVLSYRGIDIHELAEHSTFEETHLPPLVRQTPHSGRTQELLRPARRGSRSSTPRSSNSSAACPPPPPPWRSSAPPSRSSPSTTPTRRTSSHDANVRKSFRLTAQIPMIVAIFDRIRKGKPVVEADKTLSHAANFLWMLNGEKPSDTATKSLRHRAHPPRRSRAQRQHLRRARHRRHALGSSTPPSPAPSAPSRVRCTAAPTRPP